MRVPKVCLLVCLAPFLLSSSLAAGPELVSEIAIEGKTVHGDVLSGKLILSSPQDFQVLTAGGNEVYRAELGENQGLVSSEDGEFFGITTYSTKATPGLLSAEKFELYSADGNKLWEIENPGVSEFFISREAKLIVGMSGAEAAPESEIAFYDSNGDLISATKVRLAQGVSFSSDGEHILVNSAKDGLLLFDRAGRLTNRFGPGDQFAMSSDGKYVAAASEGNLKLFDVGKPARELTQSDSPVRGMSFSPDNSYLSVIEKKNLYLFQVETGKLLWRYTLEKPELSFVSLGLSLAGERTIAGVDSDNGSQVPSTERHTQGLVYVFDDSGQPIWQEGFSYRLWSAMFPLVRISPDGTRFSVTTREKVYQYEGNWSEK